MGASRAQSPEATLCRVFTCLEVLIMWYKWISQSQSLSLSSFYMYILYTHTYTQLYIQYEPTTSKPKCPGRRGSRPAGMFAQALPVLELQWLSQDLPHRRPRSRLGPCDDSSTEDQSTGPASNLQCDPTTRRASLAFSGPFSPKSLRKCQMYQNQREGPGSGSGKRPMNHLWVPADIFGLAPHIVNI